MEMRRRERNRREGIVGQTVRSTHSHHLYPHGQEINPILTPGQKYHPGHTANRAMIPFPIFCLLEGPGWTLIPHWSRLSREERNVKRADAVSHSFLPFDKNYSSVEDVIWRVIFTIHRRPAGRPKMTTTPETRNEDIGRFGGTMAILIFEA